MTSSSLCDLHWSQTRSTLPAFSAPQSYLLWLRHPSPNSRSGFHWLRFDVLLLQWSDENWCIQHDMAVDMCRDLHDVIIPKVCVLVRARSYISRIYEKDAAPGFEPSTLSMTRMPMRYDALDRSTTKLCVFGFQANKVSKIQTLLFGFQIHSNHRFWMR